MKAVRSGVTVDLLDALQVVQRQLEVLRVHVLIEGSHDGAGIIGVLQTQSVTQLMDRHQEQVIPCRPRLYTDYTQIINIRTSLNPG